MKTTSLSAYLAALILLCNSCSLFDKVNDTTFDIVLEHTFNVSITYNDTGITYQTQELLDAASVSPDFDKYKNSIKNITVNSVSYVIQNVTVPAAVLFQNSIVAYSSISTTTFDPTIQEAVLGADNIKGAEGKEVNLNFNAAALNDMSNLLKNSKELNVYLQGVLSSTPAKFDVVFRIKATISAHQL